MLAPRGPECLDIHESHFHYITQFNTGFWIGVRQLLQCCAFAAGSQRDPIQFSSVQFSSVAQLCPTLCDPMNRSTPGLLVHHQLLEFTQTCVHRVSDAIQPSHPLSSPSSPAPSPSQLHLIRAFTSVELHY